ncbi:Calcium-activated potassium channel slo-1 [Lamellibrachia satsuma]|nr:Calcium-activated potassium channel slo-1 [Lamellibrachia satsuma]
MAILAQNCLAPGFATLLSNLFTMRSSLPEKFNSWQDDYEFGASNEIYSETFSKSFYDMTFRQAAELCYLHHDVLLVAVNICDKNKTNMKVNPGNDVVIRPGDVGFFIAQSFQQVARYVNVKAVCHKIITAVVTKV